MAIVIVGAGHAAAQCIINLRRLNVTEAIVVIGDEPSLPYMRPPLSKAFLQDKQTAQQLLIKPEAFYEDNQIEWLHAQVLDINTISQTVSLDNGQALNYSKLVLATGAKLRRLNTPGADLENIHYLKTLADAELIKASMQQAQKLVVCGAGYIGLEVAASARQLGLDVTVIDLGQRIMQRTVSPLTSDYFTQLHTDMGVNIICNQAASQFVGTEKVNKVVCADGTEYDADLVVIGIGVEAQTDLADKAGLQTNNGIQVNEFCQTSSDNVYAIGDCSYHYNPLYKRALRLECIQNANGQAKVAAAHIADQAITYNELPWFWSDQYDTKLQIAGLLDGYEQLLVRRADEEASSFSVLALQNDILIAIEAVNQPKDFIAAKGLISQQKRMDIEKLKDHTVPLSDCIA